MTGGQIGGPALAAERVAELERLVAEYEAQGVTPHASRSPEALKENPRREREVKRDAKRDRYARQREAAQRAETADFDAFRAQQAPTTLGVRIRGRVFHLPKQAPLSYTLTTERHQQRGGQMTTEELRRMVTMLLGPDALDHIIEAGYDHDDLGILIMYASANLGSPVEKVTFAEAEQFYRDNEDAMRGKAPAPNRADRRQSGKRKRGKRSSGAGR